MRLFLNFFGFYRGIVTIDRLTKLLQAHTCCSDFKISRTKKQHFLNFNVFSKNSKIR